MKSRSAACMMGMLTLIVVTGAGCSSKNSHTPGDQPVVMPDLVGQYWEDAEPHLRSIGWIGVIDRDADTDAGIQNRNRIIDQTPEPGAALDHDDVITLTFGV